jgi:hypothetical protein
MNTEYPDFNQKHIACDNSNKGSLLEEVLKILYAKYDCGCAEQDDCDCKKNKDKEEELTLSNLIAIDPKDYLDFGEQTEDYDVSVLAKYKYSDPVTNEIFFFDRMSTYRKNGRPLVFIGKAAEYKGSKVTLNKPFRTSNGPKKFAVYTKNDKGKVVIVRFGDPNMKIKKNIPERRKSFRARHNCDNPGPKWKARYWSCKAW